MGFRPLWVFRQSERHPSFWVGTPQVPGGRTRVMATDDFGNAFDLSFELFAIAVDNANH